jgi:hypothetical protein
VEQGKTSQSQKFKSDRTCVNGCMNQIQYEEQTEIELHCEISWMLATNSHIDNKFK